MSCRKGSDEPGKIGNWKAPAAIAFFTLTAAIISILREPSYPRPKAFFVTIGIAAAALYLWITLDGKSQFQVAWLTAATVFLAFLLRWTTYRPLAASSSDQISHYAVRAGYIVREGYVGPFGIYEHSPLIHILIATLSKLAGYTSGLDSIILMAAASSMLPVLVAGLLYRFAGKQSSLHGMLLTAFFPLFTRTGVIFETEALSLPYFILVIYLSILVSQYGDWTHLGFILAVTSAAFVHFFYPFVILGTLLAGIYLYDGFSSVHGAASRLFPGLVVIGFFSLVLYRVVSTDRGAGLFASMLFERSGGSLPDSILGVFTPTQGAIGESTTTAKTTLDIMANFTPALMFLILGVVGGLLTVVAARRDPDQQVIIAYTTATGVGTLVGLLFFSSSESLAIGFRLYYYAGVFIVAYAAVALATTPELLSRIPSARLFLIVVFTFLIMMTAGLAPMSSLGNNVEPWFGSPPNAVTEGDANELTAMNRSIPGDTRIHKIGVDRINLPPDQGPFAPYLPEQKTVVAADTECGGNRIWSGKAFAVCDR
ncbi:hypothetical protein Z052_18235 [Halorubrum sp. C191]|uniref:glycosyltransferase family 39 protein n=1 Tax=Halorubrum sp. C191 TaxID=1383842 RepID=UPI000C0778A0|nr:hypothetical protein [Halorubrum sp. C191]PHQ40810.1 hypothetical protein Z052_18235 [Halorubrum sp. C191]